MDLEDATSCECKHRSLGRGLSIRSQLADSDRRTCPHLSHSSHSASPSLSLLFFPTHDTTIYGLRHAHARTDRRVPRPLPKAELPRNHLFVGRKNDLKKSCARAVALLTTHKYAIQPTPSVSLCPVSRHHRLQLCQPITALVHVEKALPLRTNGFCVCVCEREREGER